MLKQIVLLESIDHLEDLSPSEFVQTVETIKNRIVTEKLDGANLWFGLDATGFYTSREAKTPTRGRFYDVADYGDPTPNSNAFRAAHAALEKVEGTIRQHLKEGDAVEIEVLFGRQPNTVVYGLGDKNFIVILRGVAETPEERVKSLASALKGKHVDAESTIVSSGDGISLQSDDMVMKWSFTNVAPIPAKKINIDAVMDMLEEMKKFLAQKNTVVPGASNQDVIELSLGSVKKDLRDAVRAEKGKLEARLMHDFKGPIKELLLSKFVRKIKPFLQSPDLHPSEKDIGVEGVVIRDPVTNNQVKIVDKQVFTELNQFNSSVRSEISGLVISLDPNQSLKNRGGIYGEAKIRIAAFLGIPNLARSSGTSAVIKSLNADSAASAAQKLGDEFSISDLRSAKTKIVAILKSAKDDIAAKLDEFKKDSDKSAVLSSGKQVTMSPEIIKKTLTSIASTNKEIDTLIDAVRSSSSPAELAVALYGRTLDSVFKGGNSMKESYSLIKTVSEDGEGATGAAAVAGGEGAGSAEATTASAIAPVPFKLFGTKPIVRRMRNYAPEKKFSKVKKTIQNLLKKINEDESKVDALANASDVDDSIHAKNDVEFRKLRNSVGMSDTVSQVDVSNYLKKAHDVNDEVDTVIFGMELDDGSVVKVYVNAQEATKFEEALSQMLGKEDDIEKVIDALATTFDIVDVVWPEVEQKQPEETDIIDAQQEKEEQEKEEEQKDAASSDTDHASKDEKEESEEEIHLGVENPDEDQDKESEEETEKNTKESTMTSISQIFKQKLLKEKVDMDHEEDDAFVSATKQKYGHQIEALLRAFPKSSDRAVISLMLNLGVPPVSLMASKNELRNKIKDSSNLYRANTLFRTFANKLFAALEAAGHSVTEDAEESLLDKRLNSKYQHTIYYILGALGMPGYVEEVRPSLLTAGIKHAAKIALTDMSVRRALNGIAGILGVGGKTSHLMEPPTPDQLGKITEQDEEIVNVPRGTDARVEEAMSQIITLMSHIGLDPNKQKSIAAQLIMPNSHRALTRISANSQLMRLMTQLNSKLSLAKVGVQESSVAGASDVKFVTVNLGNDVALKLHEDEAQKLFHAIHLDHDCSVLNKSGKRFAFHRMHDGSYEIRENAQVLAHLPADEVAKLKLKLID